MKKLIIANTSVAQWYDLVTEAEQNSAIKLNQDLESYLVFLLLRFMSKPEIAASVLTMRFLQAIATANQTELQELADECLLYAGLFPKRAERKHIDISYFVHLGQNAYISLANRTTLGNAALYLLLSKHFVGMMDVLQALRPEIGLTLLQAAELVIDVGSHHAAKILQAKYKGSILMAGNSKQQH